MSDRELSRREFLKDSAAAAAVGLAAGMPASGAAPAPAGEAAKTADAGAKEKTRSYNPAMEYRRLGKTGLWVSAFGLGGHWKRIDKMIGANEKIHGEKFNQNRSEVITRCIEQGINLVDACCGGEIMAYARALKGRRDKMYFCFSWYEKEARFPEWRTAAKMVQGLEEGMRDAGLDYVDFWRISALLLGSQHTEGEVQEIIKALDTGRKQGKVRFTGVSSHDRPWLKALVEKYPDVIQAILTPYTADTKALPTDSLFDAVKKHDVGVLGIKPFASNSLFKGDSSPNSPDAAEDDKRARLALRYILCNPAITAPIPGLVSIHQVDNAAKAVRERRTLDVAEKAELHQATTEMWAKLPEGYHWLRDWREV